jgi:hypothetical protein
MEKEQRKREMEIEQDHRKKEEIFAEKVAERVKRIEDEEKKVVFRSFWGLLLNECFS